MSAVSIEVSESVKYEAMPVIFENGKENNQDKEVLESPSVSNGSDVEVNEEGENKEDEKGSEQPPDENLVKEAKAVVENVSSDSLKDEEIEMKKQRSGTPQSRSSTPQRKSGRIRTKQLSPSKSSTVTNSHPPMKILKINLTPCKPSTNGAVSNDKDPKPSEEDSVKPKQKEVEDKEKVETAPKGPVEGDDKEAGYQTKVDEEMQDNTKADPDLPYLRSLRLISGRRSLSRSPFSPSESSTSLNQSKKKLSRRKDGHAKEENESNFQAEYEYHISTSGKRKADRMDDQSSSAAESNLKKLKNEDDDIHLYLMDDEGDKNSSEKNKDVSGLSDDSHKKMSSKQCSSSDDEMEGSTLLKNDYIIDQSTEVGFEAKEGYYQTPGSPTPSNQSGKRKWCVLM